MQHVVYGLWMRQLKRYVRSRARLLGSFAQPLLFLVALSLGFGPIYEKAGQGSYLQFLAPGIVAMSILFTAMFAGIEVIWDRQFGFLKETLVAPVPRLVIMIGRTLGGATVAVLQGVVIFLVTLLMGFRPASFVELPLALLFMFLIAILFTAIGTAIASLIEDMSAFPLIMNFLVMPIFFLSGALFPLDSLPPSVQIVARLNPLTYGVDAVRSALSGTAQINVWLSLGVLLASTAIVFAIGAWLFNRIEV